MISLKYTFKAQSYSLSKKVYPLKLDAPVLRHFQAHQIMNDKDTISIVAKNISSRSAMPFCIIITIVIAPTMIFAQRFILYFNRMTHRTHRTHRTGRGMCPKPRVRGDKPQGSSSPIKICDLMVPVGCAPQAPPHRCLVRLPLSASVRLFLTTRDRRTIEIGISAMIAPSSISPSL